MALNVKNNISGMTAGGATIARLMKITEIKQLPIFADIFSRPQESIDSLVESFKQHKELFGKAFDDAEPIVVRKSDNAIVDGNTRYEAWVQYCNETGTNLPIPVTVIDFASDDDAIRYAIDRQVKKRRLSDAEALKVAEKYAYVLPKIYGSGSKASKLANFLDVSESTAKKLLKIAKEGSEELKNKVSIGELSIDAAYNIIMDSKKIDTGPKKSETTEEEDWQKEEDRYFNSADSSDSSPLPTPIGPDNPPTEPDKPSDSDGIGFSDDDFDNLEETPSSVSNQKKVSLDEVIKALNENGFEKAADFLSAYF